MDKVINPHDKLFREIWSKKEYAKDFFINYLPKDILELIDLDSIEISKDSFIEKELKDYFSDLLYKANFSNEPGYIYFLFEHKSYQETFIHIQLLEYIIKIWRLHLKQGNKENLPIVIPLVLYHGAKSWKVDTKLSSLFSGQHKKLKEYLPDFKFILYDLTKYSDEEIRGEIISRIFLLILKHIFDKDIIQKLPKILSLFKDISNQDSGLKYLETFIRYLFNTVDNITTDEVDNIIKQSISEDKGDLIMTLAERLRSEGYNMGVQKGVQQGLQQGLQQGIQKGIQQEITESIESILDIKFGQKSLHIMSFVRKISDINRLKSIKEAIKKINSVDELKAMLN